MTGLERDAGTDCQVREANADFRADADDLAGALVTEDHRMLEREGTVAAVLVVMRIRAAQSRRFDLRGQRSVDVATHSNLDLVGARPG